MDPKMDSGIVCRYYSIDEAIENGVAPIPVSLDSTIDVQCTIDIMDHLLACEVLTCSFSVQFIVAIYSTYMADLISLGFVSPISKYPRCFKNKHHVHGMRFLSSFFVCLRLTQKGR